MVLIGGTVTIEGLPALKAKLASGVALLDDMCGEAAMAGAEAGVKAVKENPPFEKRSSRTPTTIGGRRTHLGRNSLADGRAKLIFNFAGVGAIARMRWDAKHASFIDEGAGAHEIRPKLSGEGPLRGKNTSIERKTGRQRGRATGARRSPSDVGTTRTKLRWMGPNGKWIFAEFVRHPGNKAYDFSSVAQDACVGAAIVVIEKYLSRLHTMWNG